jgi:hypothetical protein
VRRPFPVEACSGCIGCGPPRQLWAFWRPGPPRAKVQGEGTDLYSRRGRLVVSSVPLELWELDKPPRAPSLRPAALKVFVRKRCSSAQAWSWRAELRGLTPGEPLSRASAPSLFARATRARSQPSGLPVRGGVKGATADSPRSSEGALCGFSTPAQEQRGGLYQCCYGYRPVRLTEFRSPPRREGRTTSRQPPNQMKLLGEHSRITVYTSKEGRADGKGATPTFVLL